jgi:hypothetical protein
LSHPVRVRTPLFIPVLVKDASKNTGLPKKADGLFVVFVRDVAQQLVICRDIITDQAIL